LVLKSTRRVYEKSQGAYFMAKIPIRVIDAVKKFKTAVKTHLNVKKVLIFGSYAKGGYTKDSDIDVYVIADNIENNFMVMLDIAPLSIGVDTRIELVISR